MTRWAILLPVLTLGIFGALIAMDTKPASAESPAREREMTCSDGTTFTGEQVRQGLGWPPRAWRNASPGSEPPAFTFYASTVTAPDGTVVEDVTFDNTQRVARNHELVTCSFIIPIGPLTGYQADFEGFLVTRAS